MRRICPLLLFVLNLYLTSSYAQNYGWSELGVDNNALRANGPIQSICATASGYVYAVGAFGESGMFRSNYVANWNGSNWDTTGTLRGDIFLSICSDINGNIYTSGGTLIDWDYGFSVNEWNGSTWPGLTGLEFAGYVNSICVDKKGTVYIGGLVLIGGPPTGSWGIVSKYDQGIWDEIDSFQFGINSVNTLCIDTEGKLYAAGQFVDSNGFEYVAKWNGDHWSELGNGGPGLNADSAILSICADSAGNIYAAGSFKDTGGYYYVAKWDGNSWTELGNLHANGAINSICTDVAGNIYAAGNFTHSGYNYVAKWNGSSWSELGAGFGALNANGAINSICVSPAGTVYAGGAFTDSSGYECVAKYGSIETGIAKINPQALNIYPNPANRLLEINLLNSFSSSMQLRVSDISGQTLIHRTINPAIKNELNVSSLPAGLYFIQLQDGQQNWVGKFVKE